MSTFDRSALFAPLQAVARTAQGGHTLPILSCCLLEIEYDKLTMTACNMAMEASVTAPMPNINGTQRLSVSAKKLLELLRRCPDAPVELTLHGARLQVACADGKFSLQTLPAGEFPRMAAPRDAAEIELPERELKRMLEGVQCAMAERDPRQWLHGVLFSLRPDSLVVCATDFHRVAMDSFVLEHNARLIDVVIPKKTVGELTQLLSSDSGAPVKVGLAPERASFRFGPVTLLTSVIEGAFPDFERVVPRNCTGRFRINRERLQQALQRVEVLVGKFRGLRWTASGNDHLRIDAANHFEETAEEVLPIQHDDGVPFEFGYNCDYLLDVIAGMPFEDMAFEFGESGVLLASIPGRKNPRHVVSPMKL